MSFRRIPLMSSVLLMAIVAGLGIEGATAQETHPFSIHDMLAMDRISGQTVSPDGRTLVFVRRATDLEANRGRTDLWLIGIDGSDLRRLTADPAGDSSPVWAADGKSVYFLSTRSGSSQVWRIRMSGGEAVQVTDLPLDVSNLGISPDGSMLSFTMEVFVDCESIDCTVERLAEREADPASGRIYDSIFVRHWDTWKDGRRSHLFAMPARGGDAVDVSRGMDADIPSKPFGGAEEICFTPDSRGLVFVARDVGHEEPWSTDFDLYVAPIDASRVPLCLTEENEAWDTGPVFSPDGKTLAYTAMARPRYEADRMRIVLRSWSAGTDAAGRTRWSAGEAKWMSEGWDHSARSIVWSPNGNSIYTHADHLGQRALFELKVKDGSAKTLISDGSVRGPLYARDRIVFGLDHLRSPVELYTIKPNGTDLQRITHINDEKLAVARMGEPEQFSFEGANGDRVYCYVVKPAEWQEGRKYPVAFLIHGGPQGSFGNDFHYRWNPQAYAGAGYAAVMVDFHGSTGYGQAFCDAIRGDWGGKPFVDLQMGLAAALERYPWMDGDKVAALGASFGGYMVNWIAGNWPDRFTCLVNHDGNLDEKAAYFVTEELWFPEWDHEGTPWTNPEGYDKHNPSNYVQNWKTPMLVIHGALDYRVVETSGIATFNALQRMGVPSKFLYYPDENHWVLKPQNSIQWHETVLGWMDEWTK